MDDNKYGLRDEKGHWKPFKLIAYPHVFAWPPKPQKFFSWLFGFPGYILPWNLFYLAIALSLWLYLTPPLESLKTFSFDWIAFLLIRNFLLILAVFGGIHVRLFIRRDQGNLFKYNPKWQSKNNRNFLFSDQVRDNMFWTLCSAVPIWTAYEVFSLWAFANGHFFSASWQLHPVYCSILILLIPLFREFHFYVIHRLLHISTIYKKFHYIHHKNVNPGPWSGLAMHPVEHILYFSGVLIHFIIAAHPIHAIFQLTHAAVSPAISGHSGFDKYIVGNKVIIDPDGYAHYLHHKYFECNYGDGAIPLDKWFGTFHDGSDEANETMILRKRKRLPSTEKSE